MEYQHKCQKKKKICNYSKWFFRFVEGAVQAETQVGGGQTVYNMWPMMGGAAISVLDSNSFVMPVNAVPGDRIILTKPLGARLAINAMQWLKTDKVKR